MEGVHGAAQALVRHFAAESLRAPSRLEGALMMSGREGEPVSWDRLDGELRDPRAPNLRRLLGDTYYPGITTQLVQRQTRASLAREAISSEVWEHSLALDPIKGMSHDLNRT